MEVGYELPEVLACSQLIGKLPIEDCQTSIILVKSFFSVSDKKFNSSKVNSELIIPSSLIQQKIQGRGEDIVADAYATTSSLHLTFRSLKILHYTNLLYVTSHQSVYKIGVNGYKWYTA